MEVKCIGCGIDMIISDHINPDFSPEVLLCINCYDMYQGYNPEKLLVDGRPNPKLPAFIKKKRLDKQARVCECGAKFDSMGSHSRRCKAKAYDIGSF